MCVQVRASDRNKKEMHRFLAHICSVTDREETLEKKIYQRLIFDSNQTFINYSD